jgi:hypothetical protein
MGKHRFYLRADLDGLLAKSVEQLEAISHQLAMISRRDKKNALKGKTKRDRTKVSSPRPV